MLINWYWTGLVLTWHYSQFCVGTFVAVSVWEYENLASLRMSRKSVEWFRHRVQAQHRNLVGTMTKFTVFPDHGYIIPRSQPVQENRSRLLQNWWASLTPGERVFVPICAINLAVFGAWRVPALKNFMMAYFCSNPAARTC